VKHFDNKFAPLVCHSKILMIKAGTQQQQQQQQQPSLLVPSKLG
jgi:hypothetical protein